jgi:hypothetical protein
MTSNELPPIPINCPHFLTLDVPDGKIYFGPDWCSDKGAWSHDSDWPICLTDVSGEKSFERTIIACVAAEYWMKAHGGLFRYSGDCYDGLWDPKTNEQATCQQIDFYNECENNAAAWRTWARLS